MRKSRSKKSLRRQGSMDDVHIDRLSKPVDHSKLKKRIEREQRLEFKRSKPKIGMSRSRSARKSLKNNHDNSMYKSYVNKFG